MLEISFRNKNSILIFFLFIFCKCDTGTDHLERLRSLHPERDPKPDRAICSGWSNGLVVISRLTGLIEKLRHLSVSREDFLPFHMRCSTTSVELSKPDFLVSNCCWSHGSMILASSLILLIVLITQNQARQVQPIFCFGIK